MLVYADFDADRLLTLARAAKDYHSTTYKQHVIHNWIDEKKKAKARVKAPRLCCDPGWAHCGLWPAGSTRVAQALDVLDRAAPNLAGSGQFPQLGASGTDAVLQGAARKLDLPEGNPNTALFRLAKAARLQAGETQGQLKASLTLEANDEEIAGADGAGRPGPRGAHEAEKDNPGSVRLAEALTLKQDGTSVIATLAIPTSEVTDFLKAEAARKARKKAEQE